MNRSEDPSASKGVVRREIVRVVTPGTVMESKSIVEKANNFIVAIAQLEDSFGVASCDLTTGEFYVTSFSASIDMLMDEVNVYQPAEIVGDDEPLDLLRPAAAGWNRPVLFTPREVMDAARLNEQFSEIDLTGLLPARYRAVSLLTGYLDNTQKRSLGHMRRIHVYEPNQYMILDPFTRRNLELVETVRDRNKKGSLLWLLDRTRTSMGARMLRRWIDKPLLNKALIDERLEAVDTLYHSFMLRDELRRELHDIYDLERLVGRVAFGSANGRDLNALKSSIQHVPAISALCAASDSATLRKLVEGIDDCADLASMIETIIVDEPPVSVREGSLIRAGYDHYLDELREASVNGKKWLADLERQEREVTGIRTLKIGYNKVFGYYLEVSKANISMMPEGRYERKQTLANAERYVTPELKEKERLILEAEDKMVDLEYAKFMELREHLSLHLHRLQKLAEMLASLDVFQSMATVSAEQRFVKPVVTEGFDLIVEDGRHPVVEAVMEGTPFIANSTTLTSAEDGSSMLLITGPNMAGKSTYMRQVALVCIMAQIGCFVPAKKAEVPLIDRIFTRIGAADDLIGGQSTFMVEMKDIQIMTEKATSHSLVIIDELGRGTSTGEGMAIAQAVIEYVHHTVGSKALVSTHFHELAHLEETLPSLANACMAVQETGDNVTFLRKLVPGAASSSYGIYCAQLAGLPGSIISRAYTLLETHEAEQVGLQNTLPPVSLDNGQKKQSIVSIQEITSNYEAEESLSPDRGLASISALDASHMDVEPRNTQAGREVVQLSIFSEPALEQTKTRKASPKAEQLADQLKRLDLFNLTPMQAMQWLNEMKLKLMDDK